MPARPHLEDYVRQFPELGNLEDLPLDLIAEEYRVRRRWGDKPEHEIYLARFPKREAEVLAAALDRVDDELARVPVHETTDLPQRRDAGRRFEPLRPRAAAEAGADADADRPLRHSQGAGPRRVRLRSIWASMKSCSGRWPSRCRAERTAAQAQGHAGHFPRGPTGGPAAAFGAGGGLRRGPRGKRSLLHRDGVHRGPAVERSLMRGAARRSLSGGPVDPAHRRGRALCPQGGPGPRRLEAGQHPDRSRRPAARGRLRPGRLRSGSAAAGPPAWRARRPTCLPSRCAARATASTAARICGAWGRSSTSCSPAACRSRATAVDEIFDEIQFRDPKPPRQIDDTIEPLFEEICLRCLSKQVDAALHDGHRSGARPVARPGRHVADVADDTAARSAMCRANRPASAARRSGSPFQPHAAVAADESPSPTTSFIGREREISELSAPRAAPGRWLVTLMGPGGIGKTRLAQRVGRELLEQFPGGCWFAELESARTASAVAHAVASAFGVPLTGSEARRASRRPMCWSIASRCC